MVTRQPLDPDCCRSKQCFGHHTSLIQEVIQQSYRGGRQFIRLDRGGSKWRLVSTFGEDMELRVLDMARELKNL